VGWDKLRPQNMRQRIGPEIQANDDPGDGMRSNALAKEMEEFADPDAYRFQTCYAVKELHILSPKILIIAVNKLNIG
jgi:hypothetical protein